MRTIIVALDGSAIAERVIAPAHAFAERSGANLVLVTAAGAHPATGWARPYLERQAAAIQGLGTRLSTIETEVIRDRSAVDAICDLARETPDAVICMSTRGRSGVGAAVLGSVAEGVLREAGAPVLLVGPHNEVGDHLTEPVHVVVCVDESELSRTIVEPAVEVALALRADTTVTRVLEPVLALVPDAMARPDWDPNSEPELAALEAVAKEIANCGVPAAYALLRPDNPADAITRFASEDGAACIAVASHSRGNLARIVLGSVALRVVRHAHCPVLVQRVRGAAS